MQVAIVLGLAPCPSGGCAGVDPGETGVGDVLFNGAWAPASDPSLPQLGLHQNFTVEVPDLGAAGPVLLSLTHLELVGVGPPLVRRRVSECRSVGSR